MTSLGVMLTLILVTWAFVVPLLALAAFGKAYSVHTYRRVWLSVSIVLTILWMPMLGNILGIRQSIWPIPAGDIRSEVDLPGYRVEFVSNGIFSDISEHFSIRRDDGKRGYVSIDGDANACRDFHTRQEGPRVYFVCGDDPTPSYVDIEQALVFAEWQETTTYLADVEFTDRKRD